MRKDFEKPTMDITDLLEAEIIQTSSGENDPLNILDRDDFDDWYK